MHSQQCRVFVFCSLAAAAMVVRVVGEESPAKPDLNAAVRAKVSGYASSADLAAQIDAYLTSLAEPLADAAAWDEAKQARVEKQAHLLATLAMTLGMHDEPHPLKAAAPALLNAAQALAAAGADFDGAVTALAAAKLAVKGESAASADGAHDAAAGLEWHQVADCLPVMKQSHVIESAIKRGLADPRRFKARASEVAGHAVALAAMSQTLAFDPVYIGDEKDEQAWLDWCVQSRDAAAALAGAAKEQDAERASAAFQQLNSACEACHDQFR